ncbi:sodium:proton antiporter [Candidatus Saccharibacteria bacterium]|nr:sodium:proton antiporter [Candidatus Saccharibacteria bacterium]
MEISITSVLSLLSLLAIASALFFIAKRFKIPYTVLLVLVGILLVPIVSSPWLEPYFGFLDDMQLTPELLFFIFLPVLIFESGYNMNIRRMIDNAWTISLLAVVGLLISTTLIAVALYFVMPLVGIELPFIVALLFGAIISSTDPVAVLALFKEFGAPKRLTMIFEGESLFNDGTAVALFMVILAIITEGFNGSATVLEGIGSFVMMVIAGIVLGLGMALVFSRALKWTKRNDTVTATLLIISAHLVFVVSEMINHDGLFGLEVHVSAIIATTVSSLFLGNYARHILSRQTDEYMEKAIDHMAFMANSLVFLLAGLLFASSGVDFGQLWLPILVTVLVVMVVRAISVFAVTTPINLLSKNERMPLSWQLLLSWGSLRGALAIIIVLLIPEDVTVAGWSLEYSVRDFVLALTIGCILATLFIKAPLMGPLMRRLSINQPDPLGLADESDLGIYYLLTQKSRFATQRTRGFVKDSEYQGLTDAVSSRLTQAHAERDALLSQHGRQLFEQSLHHKTIRIEAYVLKQLLMNDEVNERVYRRINGKLNLQREKIEYAKIESIDPSVYSDRKDVFDRLMNFLQSRLERGQSSKFTVEERLQYYRAQMIMARKAIKTLTAMQHEFSEPVFMPEIFDKVMSRYQVYKEKSASKVDELLEQHQAELAPYLATLAARSLNSSGVRALNFLHSRGISTEDIEETVEHTFSVTNSRG